MSVRTIEYQRPWLYDRQRAAIFAPARYAVIEASTKAGKTVGCLAWLLEQAVQGQPGQTFWWVAPVYPQAKIAFRRLKRGLPRELVKANETELTITLPNETVIAFKSGEKPDNLYGEDVFAAVIDEATRLREEAWHAVRSTLTATRGPLRIIGNVKGRKNWAYNLARKAEAGEPDMHYAKLTAHDAVEAGVLAAEEVEDARRRLPDHVFRELYLAEPSDDGGNPFGLAAIRAQAFPPDNAPPLTEPVAWGWDLAKSVDWTVGIALDKSGYVCRFLRFQKPWRETVEAIAESTGDVDALVDSTGVGDPVLEMLQRPFDLHSVRGNKPAIVRAYGGSNFRGFKFTATSKQQLMEGLAIAIQQGLIRYPEGTITAELESFEYEYTRTGVRYTAPEGLFDDCVCALALAWQCLRETGALQAPALALAGLDDPDHTPGWRVE